MGLSWGALLRISLFQFVAQTRYMVFIPFPSPDVRTVPEDRREEAQLRAQALRVAPKVGSGLMLSAPWQSQSVAYANYAVRSVVTAEHQRKRSLKESMLARSRAGTQDCQAS